MKLLILLTALCLSAQMYAQEQQAEQKQTAKKKQESTKANTVNIGDENVKVIMEYCMYGYDENTRDCKKLKLEEPKRKWNSIGALMAFGVVERENPHTDGKFTTMAPSATLQLELDPLVKTDSGFAIVPKLKINHEFYPVNSELEVGRLSLYEKVTDSEDGETSKRLALLAIYPITSRNKERMTNGKKYTEYQVGPRVDIVNFDMQGSQYELNMQTALDIVSARNGGDDGTESKVRSNTIMKAKGIYYLGADEETGRFYIGVTSELIMENLPDLQLKMAKATAFAGRTFKPDNGIVMAAEVFGETRTDDIGGKEHNSQIIGGRFGFQLDGSPQAVTR